MGHPRDDPSAFASSSYLGFSFCLAGSKLNIKNILLPMFRISTLIAPSHEAGWGPGTPCCTTLRNCPFQPQALSLRALTHSTSPTGHTILQEPCRCSVSCPPHLLLAADFYCHPRLVRRFPGLLPSVSLPHLLFAVPGRHVGSVPAHYQVSSRL